MKKKILGVFVSLFVVAMLAVPMSTVYATKSIAVSGTFFPTAEPGLSPRFAGKSANNFLSIIDGPQMWTGSFTGTTVVNGLWIIHKADNPEAPGYHLTAVQNVFELNVVYDGKTGTLTIRSDHSNWRILSGTGELTNLRGQGKVSLETMPYTYTGQVHFDP